MRFKAKRCAAVESCAGLGGGREAKNAPAKTTTSIKAAPIEPAAKSLFREYIARQAFMLRQERGGSETENRLEAERRLH